MVQIPSRAMLNRVARRLNGALKPGATFTNTAVLYEIIPILGATRLMIRAKVTAAASLDLVFLGPDFDPAQTVAFASLVGTRYASNNPTQVALVANTENFMKVTVEGENYALVKLTGGASGAITFIDVNQVIG